MTHGEAAAAVEKLKPSIRQSGDRIYNVHCEGKHYLAWTKISRKASGKDLSAKLESLMVRELKITKPFWGDLSSCTKSRPEYLALLGHAACQAPPPAPKGQGKKRAVPKQRRR